MGDILKKIDTKFIEENNETSTDKFIVDCKVKLENANILCKESAKYKSDATFESNIWILHNKNTDVYNILDFSKVIDMVKLNLIDKDDYLILKCWIAEKLVDDGISGSTIKGYFFGIERIFIETHGFKKKLIHSKKGNAIDTYIEHSSNDRARHDRITALKSYVNFLDRIGFIPDGYELLSKSISQYKTYLNATMRDLPSNQSIFLTDYCIKDFFNGEKTNDLLRKIYYPILIWWKVSNVIPMRPSELFNNVYRKCTFKHDNKYYLIIDRIKIQRTKHTISKPKLPILKKVEITKEIYDLINEYINMTDFTESHTLISYNALCKFKEEFLIEKQSDKYKDFLPTFKSGESTKFNPLNFATANFATLLTSFYDNIVEDVYGYALSQKERMTPGDTRHLAFCSLLLQGVSPVEIALLGGHTTLETQDSYTNHVSYYIDSEILNYISDRNIHSQNSKMFRSLKDIVFNKPYGYQLDVDLSEFDKTDDGVGYCLLDVNSNDFCEDVPYCAFCSKWWCEPTNNSYKEIKHYILNKKISPLQSEIEVEEEFFRNLINETEIVNLNGLAGLEKHEEQDFKSQSLKLRSKADKLAFLKASLLEQKFEKENEIQNNYLEFE